MSIPLPEFLWKVFFFLMPLTFKSAALLSQVRFLCHRPVPLIHAHHWVVNTVDKSQWHAALSPLGGRSHTWQNLSGSEVVEMDHCLMVVRYPGCYQVRK